LTYLPHAEHNPFDSIEKTPVSFGAITLVLGDDRYDYPFADVSPLSKAALIEKIGARHTGAECALIQKMHDLTLDLGAECHPLTRRAGARHSHADQGLVQRMHDDCAGLGATCKALPEKDRVYGSQVLKEGEIIKGGPTSGNWGHSGRKGKRGGSSSGGGFRRIGVKPGSKPSRKKIAAAKKKQAKPKSQVKPKTAKKPKSKPRPQAKPKAAARPPVKPAPAKKPAAKKKQAKTAAKPTSFRGIIKDLPKNLGLLETKRRNNIINQLTKLSSDELDKYSNAIMKEFDKLMSSKGSDTDLVSRNAAIQIRWVETALKRQLKKAQKELAKISKSDQDTFAKDIEDITKLIKKVGNRRKKIEAVLITKAQSDAPNYQAADTPQRCANCRFLGDPGRDWCDLFDFTADPDYHCDDWEAQRPDEIPGYVANKGDLAALTEGILTLRGGRTSGNWGHAGRKGKRGGSGAGGGFKRIGVKPGASRKEVKRAAKKKAKTKPKIAAKPKAQTKKPAVKTRAKGNAKLDNIFDKAPKGSEKNFTNHLMGKMISGEISLQDAQGLTARFRGESSKTTTAPKTGSVKSSKKFTETELKNGDAKKQWDSWSGNLSKQEKDAFKAYSSEPFDELSTDFSQINNHLRGKDKNPSKETGEAIRLIDSGINKGNMPQDTTVFRGFPSSVLGADPSKMVGKTITDKAYTSSSMSERVANQFSKDLIAEIKIPKGAKGAFMDATLNKSDLEQLDRDPEHELVLPRGSKFRILSTKKTGAKTKVFMELIDG
jgi:hypothetical protein